MATVTYQIQQIDRQIAPVVIEACSDLASALAKKQELEAAGFVDVYIQSASLTHLLSKYEVVAFGR